MALFDSSVSTSIAMNTTINKIERNLIASAGASSLTNCTISIGNITFERSNGCYVTVQNLCSSNSSAALEAVISAVTDTLNTLTIDQQNTLKPSLVKFGVSTNISVNTLSQDFRTNVTNICTSSAIVNNVINIQNLSFTECSSNGPAIEFKFINSGQASANCAMNILLNTNMDLTNTLSAKTSSFIDLNLTFSTMFIMIGIIFGLFLVCYFMYKYFSMYGKLKGGDLVKIVKENNTLDFKEKGYELLESYSNVNDKNINF